MHPAALEDAALLAQCKLGRGRSGGPGGQHRNKVETLVTILHEPTGLKSHAGERRSQIENKQVAIRRIRLELAVHVRTEPPLLRGQALLEALDKPEGSALWRSRCLGGRIACSPLHHDFPTMLAEAMDYLAACGWEPGEAGRRLGVSGTQLVKLLKDHAPAMVLCNQEREKRGLRGLK